jgi:hypothetical protein
MKVDVDSRRTPRQFQVGKLVLLKLQPYVQSSVVSGPCPKLALKFFGPYKVLEKFGQVAYKLELPTSALIHSSFHVSQLKAFTPDHMLVFSELPTTPQLDLAELAPEKIQDQCLTKKGNAAVT